MVYKEKFTVSAGDYSLNLLDVVKKAAKYLVQGLSVALAAYYIPQKKLRLNDVAMLGVTAAATFALLDMYVPKIAEGARKGAGFGIGMNLVGGKM